MCVHHVPLNGRLLRNRVNMFKSDIDSIRRQHQRGCSKGSSSPASVDSFMTKCSQNQATSLQSMSSSLVTCMTKAMPLCRLICPCWCTEKSPIQVLTFLIGKQYSSKGFSHHCWKPCQICELSWSTSPPKMLPNSSHLPLPT